MPIKVKLTVYRDVLIIETLDPDSAHPDFVPAGDGRFGCVILNTKENLGASKEAIAWLSEVKRSGDSIGDVDWFDTTVCGRAFGWIGGPLVVKDRASEGSRAFRVSEDYVEIPNEPPPEACRAIDAALTPSGSS